MSDRPAIAAALEPREDGELPHALAFVLDAESRAAVEAAFTRVDLGSYRIEEGDIRTAIERLGVERSPRILIVDLERSQLPLSDIDELAEVCEPGVMVIALGQRDEVALFRGLIERGVSDYIVKPVPPELLAASLKRALQGKTSARPTSRLGRTAAVLGVRGGVGATTLACGLAHVIANRQRRRAAVLDLDLQFGTVALAFDLDPSNALRDALEQVEGLDPLFVERLGTFAGDILSVFAAEVPLGEVAMPDPLAVDAVLDTLRHRFHHVIVDLPRSGSELCLHVLERADSIVLVTDFSLAAMRDSLRLTQLISRLNPAARTLVVVNRAGWQKGAEIPQKEFERGIGRKVDLIVPFDPAHVAAAVNSGQLHYAEAGPVATALTKLAEAVTGRTADKRAGLLQRLLRWRR